MKRLLMILFLLAAGMACAQGPFQVDFAFLEDFVAEKKPSQEMRNAGIFGGVRVDVYLLHGEQDLKAPVSVAHYITGLVLQVRARVSPADKRLTFPFTNIHEILRTPEGLKDN